MNETRFSDESPPDLLRFSYVAASSFSQMHSVWRSLKLEELRVVESLLGFEQPEACLDRAEKWAVSYRDTTDLALAPAPWSWPIRSSSSSSAGISGLTPRPCCASVRSSTASSTGSSPGGCSRRWTEICGYVTPAVPWRSSSHRTWRSSRPMPWP
jgi:hypothetical protein